MRHGDDDDTPLGGALYLVVVHLERAKQNKAVSRKAGQKGHLCV